ncbi:maltase 1-like [Camponotus floridanus]|uniref:maltase 1-like n=1 Tax=Camponotus floridanus TaxID=104421 RepID=UPI000DC68485|nr:maltase 1-like [Camponotus floridanus]
MSLTTYFCAAFLLVSSSSAEIYDKLWWNNTVLYQISPRSMYDTNGDGIGDLKGITSKLHYIVDSGNDVIRLSPIYSGPKDNFGSSISNFTKIDPIFGTMDDFHSLLTQAHKLDLKVILDIVPNHSSDEHPWFQKALQGDEKYKNYYMFAEGKNKDNITPPNNWISKFDGPAWTYVDSLGEFYLHQYGPGLPDLNYSNPEVLEEMTNILKFWLDTGIDGFSVYSAPYIFEDKELRDEPRSYVTGATPQDYSYLNHIYTMDQERTHELVRNLRTAMDKYVDERNGVEKMLLIEADTSLLHIIKYYADYTLSLNFDLIKNVTVNSSADDVKKEIDLFINSLPSGEVPNWLLGNYDNPRVASRFPDRVDQMTMLSMILPGIAVTYYGDEIGMVDNNNISYAQTQDPEARNAGKEHYAAVSRDPERTPFQWNAEKNAGFSTADSTWLPVNSNYKQLNLKEEMGIKNSHYDIYKNLAHLHRKEPALTEGSYTSFTMNDGAVLGVVRNSGDRYVLLLINYKDDISQDVDLSDHDLPETLKLKVACSGSHSSLKQQVDVKNIHLPEKVAVVYTSFNIQ